MFFFHYCFDFYVYKYILINSISEKRNINRFFITFEIVKINYADLSTSLISYICCKLLDISDE